MMRQLANPFLERAAAIMGLLLVLAVALPLRAAVEDDLPPALVLLQNTGRYEQLAEALEKAVEEQPQSAALHYWLGRSFYELRNYDGAEDSLDKATELAPNHSEYFDWLGKATGRKAQRANPFSAMSLARKTHRSFETAVRLSPTNVEAQRDLIRYLLNAPGFLGGGEDKALQQIQALSVVNGVDGMLARAEYYASRKKFDLASAEYQKVLQTDLRRVGVPMEIAEYYRDRGDAANMQAAVERATKVRPDDPRLEYYRGVALVLARRDAPSAETHLRRYLQVVPNGSEVPSHSSAHEWLGKLYEAQGKRDEAAAEYEMTISLDPRNQEARKALDRIRKR
jgi:tetratricopeptide (TPR) repeat protein